MRGTACEASSAGLQCIPPSPYTLYKHSGGDVPPIENGYMIDMRRR